MKFNKLKLGEIAKPKQWKTISISELTNEGYPVYGANGKIGYYSSYNHKEETIVVTCRGATCGSIHITEPYSYVTGNAMSIDSLIESVVVKRYLYYLLKWRGFNDIITGSAQPQIIRQNLENVELLIPEKLDYQTKVVEIIDSANSIRQKRRETLRLVDEFLRSTFLEMFGDPYVNPKKWEEYSLEEVCSEIVDCPHSTPQHTSRVTKYPCIRTTDLRNGYINWQQMKYLNEEEYLIRIKRLKPKEGDVIFGREGSFGEAVRVPPNTNLSLGQRVMLFRPNENLITSVFLWFLLRSNSIYYQAQRISSGSTVPHVNVKEIKNFSMILPPINLQNQFTEIVERTEQLKRKYEQSLQESENLFNSLMQRAFRGEL